MKNLVGTKIDKLFVKKILVDGTSRQRVYECECDCGNICRICHSTIMKKNRTHSCGCFQKQFLKPGNAAICSNAGKHRKDTFVNGSNVQMTFREGTISTNTSGTQGISYSKNTHKWNAYIGFQNYRANLGYFEDINQAIAVRKAAEEAIKNNTFEEYFFELRGYHLGEKNSKIFKKSTLTGA